jgi:hypothetical protein
MELPYRPGQQMEEFLDRGEVSGPYNRRVGCRVVGCEVRFVTGVCRHSSHLAHFRWCSMGQARGAPERSESVLQDLCTREQRGIHGFRHDATVRFIHLFLVGYFVLILGVGLALWQTGMLSRVAPIWIGIGVLVAIGVGIMVSVSSGKPTLSEEIVKP